MANQLVSGHKCRRSTSHNVDRANDYDDTQKIIIYMQTALLHRNFYMWRGVTYKSFGAIRQFACKW